jgi:hypothetical protein
MASGPGIVVSVICTESPRWIDPLAIGREKPCEPSPPTESAKQRLLTVTVGERTNADWQQAVVATSDRQLRASAAAGGFRLMEPNYRLAHPGLFFRMICEMVRTHRTTVGNLTGIWRAHAVQGRGTIAGSRGRATDGISVASS